MAASPAQVRPKRGKAQYRPAPEDDEAIRRRRATANRRAHHVEGDLESRLRRGPRRVIATPGAGSLSLSAMSKWRAFGTCSIAEAERLINAAI